MPPRALVASLAAVLVPLGAGCGLGGGGDEADVRSVVSSYVQAALAGNGEQACAFYTPEMRRQAKREAREQGLGSCRRLLAAELRRRVNSLPQDVRADVRQAFTDPEEVEVDMAGTDTAKATLEVPHGVLPDPEVELKRTLEGWRIASRSG